MTGRLIYIMGPSGVGKDTILEGLSGLMGHRSYFAPRMVTRPASSTERGAISVSAEQFQQLESSGSLAMSWRANGLAYGVSRDINDKLASGYDVLVNGSREYLPQARIRYRHLMPILLTASADVLQRRLMARGRESAGQIQARLARNIQFMSLAEAAESEPVFVVDNSGSIDDTICALYLHLTHASTRQEPLSCG